MMDDKRVDIHDSSQIFTDYYARIDSESISEAQKANLKKFIHQLQIGKGSKKVGTRRLISYLQTLFRLIPYFKKDFDKLTEKECEKFYVDLEHDRIRQKNGKPYKSASKDELIRGLKRYLKWSWKKEPEEYKQKAGWMKEAETVPEIAAISLEDVKRLINAKINSKSVNPQIKGEGIEIALSPLYRTLIFFLFDSGCRIEEALNLRIQDIELKTKTDGDQYYIVNVDGTKTKLAKRKITVPLSTDILTEWLKEHPSIVDKTALLFPVKYDAFRKMLRIYAKVILGFGITPHQLRHSSATYYSTKNKLSYASFCFRFGWDLNSDIPKRYIDRHKMDDAFEELDNVIQQDRVKDLKDELEDMKEQLEIVTKARSNTDLILMKISEGYTITGVDDKGEYGFAWKKREQK